jgi:hypothetical protein
MALLSEKERDSFSWELRFKSKEQLAALFNELMQDSRNETSSDFTRGRAAEKAAMVKIRLDLRARGGAPG